MREDSGPFPAILLVFLSVALVTACYFMSQTPPPTTDSRIASYDSFGTQSQTCTSYLGTPYDC
jgi:hypothetical protein